MVSLLYCAIALQFTLSTSQSVVNQLQWNPNTNEQIGVSVDESGRPLPKWFTDLQLRKTVTETNIPVQPVQEILKGGYMHTEYEPGSTPLLPVPADLTKSHAYPGNQVPIQAPNYQILQDRKEMTFNGHYRPPPAHSPPPSPATGSEEDNGNDSGVPTTCPKDIIHDRFRGRGYFFSWEDRRSKYLNLTWAAAVQFCKARCLELVSIETKDEDAFLARHIRKWRQTDVWTSGRKCDFRGCENPNLHPVDIYGWFWEGSRAQLPPTTDLFDVNWSDTGALGRPQPDNYNGHRGGENESCLAIRNNAYNDGIRWHDEVCSRRWPFICEERSRGQWGLSNAENENPQLYAVPS